MARGQRTSQIYWRRWVVHVGLRGARDAGVWFPRAVEPRASREQIRWVTVAISTLRTVKTALSAAHMKRPRVMPTQRRVIDARPTVPPSVVTILPSPLSFKWPKCPREHISRSLTCSIKCHKEIKQRGASHYKFKRCKGVLYFLLVFCDMKKDQRQTD